MSDLTAVKVPDIGDFKDVEVIELLVNVGDTIEPEQSLITVESDKASMEIPATTGGVVKKIDIKIGDKINEGSVILHVQAGGAAAAPAAAKAQASTAEPLATAAPAPAAAPASAPATAPVALAPASPTASIPAPNADGQLPHASPSVRKFARELGVELTRVNGSGPKGRITQEDVQQFVKGMMQGGGAAVSTAGGTGSGVGLDLLPWPKVDFAKFGEVDVKPLPRIKKISGANLHRNWVMIPHVTNNDEVDITGLEELRKTLNKENERSGIKVTMLAFLIKAVVAALKKYPDFNASLDGDSLVRKRYYNVGFAADTPNGLMVPVIVDADKKGVLELAQETSDLAKLARDGKLSPAQMQGGCMSISSLGGIGGTHFTPIINAPEVAILGVSKSYMKPVWDGKQFEPRLILPLSLSYDHRVIDGAAAARFNAYLGSLLTDFRRIIL
jgi:pyruvate dehydrogenase E2 component (dihydrolipoamide acetyltransferase)